MITDDQTNKVYFSEYLRDYKCWKSIKEALLEHEINFEMLPNTKDIWVRDFMPIQKDVKSFIGYEYNPDYLKEEQQYTTHDVKNCFEFTHNNLMKSIDYENNYCISESTGGMTLHSLWRFVHAHDLPLQCENNLNKTR